MPRVVVLHEGYGCDTGCCGHVVEVDGKLAGNFSFSHPGWKEDFRAFAEGLVREAGCDPAALDWESCTVSDD